MCVEGPTTRTLMGQQVYPGGWAANTHAALTGIWNGTEYS